MTLEYDTALRRSGMGGLQVQVTVNAGDPRASPTDVTSHHRNAVLRAV